MTSIPPPHHTPKIFLQILIAASAAQPAIQIVVARREEARPDLDLRGQSNPTAGATARMRNRSNDADLVNIIVEGEASRVGDEHMPFEISRHNYMFRP